MPEDLVKAIHIQKEVLWYVLLANIILGGTLEEGT
jgi:hypothetical protein